MSSESLSCWRCPSDLRDRAFGKHPPCGSCLAMCHERSGHLEPSSIKKQHAKAVKASRVRRFVLYSLRHTFLTRLGESGCDTWTLARIAGHSSIAISARYVHPSHDSVLAAVERLGGHKIGHDENQGVLTQQIKSALPA